MYGINNPNINKYLVSQADQSHREYKVRLIIKVRKKWNKILKLKLISNKWYVGIVEGNRYKKNIQIGISNIKYSRYLLGTILFFILENIIL